MIGYSLYYLSIFEVTTRPVHHFCIFVPSVCMYPYLYSFSITASSLTATTPTVQQRLYIPQTPPAQPPPMGGAPIQPAPSVPPRLFTPQQQQQLFAPPPSLVMSTNVTGQRSWNDPPPIPRCDVQVRRRLPHAANVCLPFQWFEVVS